MMIPGQELRDFTVLQPDTRGTESGREGLINDYKPIGVIQAVLAQATTEETERWRQLTHPITHKIIMQNAPPFEVKSGYIFERAGRRFYVQALPYDVGDLGQWTIFYCDERTDVT